MRSTPVSVGTIAAAVLAAWCLCSVGCKGRPPKAAKQAASLAADNATDALSYGIKQAKQSQEEAARSKPPLREMLRADAERRRTSGPQKFPPPVSSVKV